MYRYRKFLLLIVLMCLQIPSAKALSAQSSILIDAHTGRVILENNAYERRPMASTTKIMTAIVALERGDLNSVATVSHNAARVEGSSMYLKGGEKIKLIDLLYGLMLNSGNDAATAIAEHIAKDVESFAKLMNEKAMALGLRDTSFTNPHGLDHENHYTTAYDLAQMTRHALANDKFSEICGTRIKTIGTDGGEMIRTLGNHNKLLTMYKGADGVKTGFTKKSGRCLVSSATKNSLRLIAVTLNAPDDWNDHMKMLDFGFSNYHYQKAFGRGDYMKSVSVIGAKENRVPLYSDLGVELAVKKDDKIKVVYDVPNFINAPVFKGQLVGSASVYLNSELVKTVNLVADRDIPITTGNKIKNSFGYVFSELLKMVGG